MTDPYHYGLSIVHFMYDEESISVAVERKGCLAHVIYRDLVFTPLDCYRHRLHGHPEWTALALQFDAATVDVCM